MWINSDVVLFPVMFDNILWSTLTYMPHNQLSVQILIQGITSLLIVMYGVLYIAGDFKEIRAVVDMENKSWETLRNTPSFQIFNHRGRSLSPEYVSDASLKEYISWLFNLSYLKICTMIESLTFVIVLCSLMGKFISEWVFLTISSDTMLLVIDKLKKFSDFNEN